MPSTKGSAAAAPTSKASSTPATKTPDAKCPVPAPATNKEDLANVPEYTTIPVLDVGIALDAPASAFTEPGPHGDALRALALQMREACTQCGFFLIKNHGVPDAQIEDMVSQCRRLFALPKEVKEQFRVGHNLGYFAIGEENLNPAVQVHDGDFKEGMDLVADVQDRRPGEVATPYPTNAQVPGFRAACEAYFDVMTKLGRAVMRVLAVAMGQPATFFDRALARPRSQLRLLRYPAAPPGMTEARLSCGAHTDYGGITMLAVDSPGLQVLVPSATASTSNSASDVVAHPTSRAHASIHGGTWMRVPVFPGTLVVNLADMIARYTNRTFHSTLHRVVHAGVDRDRFSIPFFFDMDAETVVQVLPQFVPGGELASKEIKETYFPEPIVFGEHLMRQVESTFGATGKQDKGEVAAS
ncbi:hypothetical protein AMAG_13911 [Allomyces macrogynus ATCC 38327]|uniref:Fe2OG dioxygenase domain-containing protein n=1 Tax=Allomyces macrogynus (strain ATCC 38327) TaxID=578462 RepID=A0A0L0T2S8_ALLM3|nr:hypothetical protein AMAG_13911 [Allomyces macrogynus ATCC 38327]|eukprot:KNE69036.1 hypothetical protein AMAG_13911 [Allomyces macrogynus ATCC 38327]